MKTPKKTGSKMKCGGIKKMQPGGSKPQTYDPIRSNRTMKSRADLEKAVNDPRNKNSRYSKIIKAALTDPKLMSSDSLGIPNLNVIGRITGNKEVVPNKKKTYNIKSSQYKFKKGGSKKKS